MTNTIYIVEGHTGEYSDRQDWPVAWTETEAEAIALRDRLQRENDGLTDEDREYQNRASTLSKLTDKSWSQDYNGTKYTVYALERAS